MTTQNFTSFAWIFAFVGILFLGTTTQNVEAIESDLMYSKTKIDSLECVIEKLQTKNQRRCSNCGKLGHTKRVCTEPQKQKYRRRRREKTGITTKQTNT